MHDSSMRVIVVAAALIACAPSAGADVPVGQGPTEYTVQPQPAPGSCHYRTAASGDTLPDPVCTHGATNPAVTQDNLATTICMKGYAKSIRPTAAITSAEKRANAKSYNYTGPLADVEYDHLIPLALGGSPTIRAICGWSRALRPTRRTKSKTGYTASSAQDEWRSQMRKNSSRRTGLGHRAQRPKRRLSLVVQ